MLFLHGYKCCLPQAAMETRKHLGLCSCSAARAAAIAKEAAGCRCLDATVKEQVPGGQVMWYDAVTTEGKLQWQDCLSPLNQPFFDACSSGIFVNYTWRVCPALTICYGTALTAHCCCHVHPSLAASPCKTLFWAILLLVSALHLDPVHP